MSVLEFSKLGWLISHENIIKEFYNNVNKGNESYEINPALFEIQTPFKQNSSKSKKSTKEGPHTDFYCEVNHVQKLYTSFYEELKNVFGSNCEIIGANSEAIQSAIAIYSKSGLNPAAKLQGSNHGPAITNLIENTKYLFPENCHFYCRDVNEIEKHLISPKFDLILLDPPWWNKYIRRKRKHVDNHCYNMMYNDDIKNLPLEKYLNDDGLIAVWCTNSQQHLDALKGDLFPKWGVQFQTKWYWIKITKFGETVCPFGEPPSKQPFEQIIFGHKESRSLPPPPHEKLVVSVPSALHSHKPPLSRLIREYLPPNPACLEVFARYLQPGWSSYGNEVLRLQNECLFTRNNRKCE